VAVKPSEIELHIEELVLDGFEPADRHAVADALQSELARLLATHGLPHAHAARLEGAQIDAGSVRLKPNSTARATGAEVARAIHGGLTR
jgi:hypothetical protein